MSLATASGRLRAKLDLAYPALVASSERIWSSPLVRELYPVWLSTMHGIVRTPVTLMEAALERARALAPDDEVAAGLVPYLAHHAPEEAGHDKWLLEDLEALGGDPLEALRRIPSARIATFVGAQYYWLRHHHPVSLLGHMAVVEGNPPQVGFSERLRELTGYPPEAFRAIRRHERLDIRHREELYEAIDSLPLRPEHETMIGISALHTVQAAIAVFEEIYSAVNESRRLEVVR
jgi:Iron-containing redox enzyme